MKNLIKQHLFTNGVYDARRARNVAAIDDFATLAGGCASEKVWLVFNKRPRCYCGKQTAYISFTQGYRPYCSRTCQHHSAVEAFERRQRHDKLWSDPAWKESASRKMREAHFKTRGASKLAKIAEKQIVPLDEVTADRKKNIRWQHVCGQVFLKSFERPAAVYCPACHVSTGQGELYEAIRARYSGRITVNDREAIAPKEIDIYLPELKLGFEFNGRYWHPGDGTREKNKSAECKDAGIKLVHVWEVEWKKDRTATIKLLDKLLGQKTFLPFA